MFIAALLFTVVSCGDSGKNKKISIAYANWAEGIAITNLAKAIFEDQGYDVKLLNADLAPIFTSISRKKADIFMDVWMPVTMEDYMKQYGDKLEIIGDIYDSARIGLVVPDYVTINSIEELNAEKEDDIDSLAAKYDDDGAGSAVDDELAALKAKMGL